VGRDSRERRGARADLDAAHPGELRREARRDVRLRRADGTRGGAQEVAPSFVFLASDDASYMTGQVLHPNGGEIVNG
jgi:NAD(P)-dependent dehydrogenase (short-subunit alcohol dehydrogenase family)